MKRVWIVLFLFFVIGTLSFSEESVVSLSEYVSLVLTHNPDIEQAVRFVQESGESLEGFFSIEDTRIDLSGSVQYLLPQDEEGGGSPQPNGQSVTGEGQTDWSGDVNLTVPIVPQVSVSGRVNDEGSGSVSLSLKPFALGLGSPADEESYKKAVLQLVDVEQSKGLEAEGKALSYLLREKELAQAKEELVYGEKSYEIVEQRYEINDATYEELQDALSSLSTVRKDALNAERNLLNAVKELQLLIGPDEDVGGIVAVTLEELYGLIEWREAEVEKLSSVGELSSLKLEQLEVELDRLRADLDRMWMWRPDLSVSASASIPLDSVQASVSLSFSYGDIKSEERSDLEEEIGEKLDDIIMERFSLDVEREVQEKGVTMSEQLLETNGVDLEQDRLSLRESELLYEQGQLTELELEQARLRLSATENRTFSAASDLFTSLGELLLLYGGT